jgi:hypothetical protein
MRTSLTRAVAGTAVVAAAMLAAAGTASAAGAAGKLPTTLTAVDSKATIAPGQTDLITGTLKSGSKLLAGEFVYLDRLVKGKFVAVAGDRSGSAGHVYFTVKPSSTSTYQLQFRGTPSYDASHSNNVTILVLKPKAATTLTATESKTVINPGQSDLITGTLTSGTKPVPGQHVFLERLIKGTFVPVQEDVTGGLGHVFYTVKPSATASFELVFRGSAGFKSSHSNVVTVLVVKAATTLAATESKTTITPGQSDLITGTLMSGTKAVANQFVYLDRLINGKFVAVAGDRTGGAGHVFFTVKPSKTASYELVFRGTTFYAASHSNVVIVTVS